MFFNVYEVSQVSSNLKMAGGWYIYSLPSQTSCLEPLPLFLLGVGTFDDRALVHPVTLNSGVSIELLKANIAATG
jgi:hypothetical protein